MPEPIVKFKRGSSSNLPQEPLLDGSILLTTNDDKLFVDHDNSRKCINPNPDWNAATGNAAILNKPTFINGVSVEDGELVVTNSNSNTTSFLLSTDVASNVIDGTNGTFIKSGVYTYYVISDSYTIDSLGSGESLILENNVPVSHYPSMTTNSLLVTEDDSLSDSLVLEFNATDHKLRIKNKSSDTITNTDVLPSTYQYISLSERVTNNLANGTHGKFMKYNSSTCYYIIDTPYTITSLTADALETLESTTGNFNPTITTNEVVLTDIDTNNSLIMIFNSTNNTIKVKNRSSSTITNAVIQPGIYEYVIDEELLTAPSVDPLYTQTSGINGRFIKSGINCYYILSSDYTINSIGSLAQTELESIPVGYRPSSTIKKIAITTTPQLADSLVIVIDSTTNKIMIKNLSTSTLTNTTLLATSYEYFSLDS